MPRKPIIPSPIGDLYRTHIVVMSDDEDDIAAAVRSHLDTEFNEESVVYYWVFMPSPFKAPLVDVWAWRFPYDEAEGFIFFNIFGPWLTMSTDE